MMITVYLQVHFFPKLEYVLQENTISVFLIYLKIDV